LDGHGRESLSTWRTVRRRNRQAKDAAAREVVQEASLSCSDSTGVGVSSSEETDSPAAGPGNLFDSVHVIEETGHQKSATCNLHLGAQSDLSADSAHPAGGAPSQPDAETLNGAVPQPPEIERLLRGWQAALWASEACSRWDGPRLSHGAGSRYWSAKRNENACWRRCYLERARAHAKRPEQGGVKGPFCFQHDSCRVCVEGKVCSCPPDPLQPLRTLEPESCDPVAPQPPPGLGWEDCHDQTLGPGAAWRHLLRGTHALSLQGAPENISLLADNPEEALAARLRHKNVAWRRWWVAERGQVFQPSMVFPPTPTASQEGTPRAEPLTLPQANAFHMPLYPSPVLYVPVPLHLAAAVQQYADQLQAADQLRAASVAGAHSLQAFDLASTLSAPRLPQ